MLTHMIICLLRHRRLPARALFILAMVLASMPAMGASVTVSEKDIAIPTYLAGDPEPNPMFYFGRGSQGAQGRVYPYPLYDSLTDIKSNKIYRLVYLENEYVRIGILPEIGGRIFEAVDKSNGYDFIYRQHVIKPALIGIIGAWISGGVEWNIPHHHRATTFLPVQYRTEKNADGSKTVWVGELELRQRMRWAVGYTLRPGKSYLECSIRIINRTPVVQTMLCFANVAVHVNETYQVIYPPRTQLVTFHTKNDFTTWPIATTRYVGIDFTRGVDVSWFSNHISATSMFAWNYEDDFFAGYDHGKHAGIISFANHHVVPGKKLWTWGNGPRGRMWDKILTDSDGPYIELMVGGYSDNQPDYSWLQPYEAKSFEMYWYPFRGIDGVKEANLDAAVNLEATNGLARFGFCTTAAHRSARVLVTARDMVVHEEAISIDPAKPYTKEIHLPADVDPSALRASLVAEGRELVAYKPVKLEPVKMPEPVKPPPAPADLQTTEDLFLAGQRIEQFHAPGRDPEPYWTEALRRDPGDTRVNIALGIRRVKQARFVEAEQFLGKAIERLTAKFTSPKDGEAFYYLGLALNGQGRTKEANGSLYKATWSQAWRAPAYFSLAEIASLSGRPDAALDCINRSLDANALNLRALTLKAALLRKRGDKSQARELLDLASAKTDPLDVRLMAERWLLESQRAETRGTSNSVNERSLKRPDPALVQTFRDFPNTALETAVEYGNAGLWSDGEAVLLLLARTAQDPKRVSPLAYYYLAQFAGKRGDTARAAHYRARAMEMDPEYVFPFQWEAISALRGALAANSRDARAAYYLGNLLFDWQPEEAVKLWEQSAAADSTFAVVHRNLAIAASHMHSNDTTMAIAELEKAVALPRKYAAHFAELDELYAAAGVAPEKRLALLEQNQDIVLRRDEALSREIGLKVFAGKYDEAIRLMSDRKFRVWEGGSLAVADHWVDAHILRGQQRLAAGKAKDALADFQAAASIPDNLPSDTRRGGGRDREIAYLSGLANDELGNSAQARQSWESAAKGGGTARRGRGEVSEQQVETYYQALARRKLGQSDEADEMLRALSETKTPASDDSPAPGGNRPRRRSPGARAALAHYIAGLGHLGLGEKEKAKAEFRLSLQSSPDALGPKASLDALAR